MEHLYIVFLSGLVIILFIITFFIRRRFIRQARQFKMQDQYYQSLFWNNPDLIIMFDTKGHFLSANYVVESFGYTEEELISRAFSPFIVEELLEMTLENFRKAASGTAVNYNTAFYSKNGNRIEINVTNAPIIVDGKIVGVYGIHKDITEQKRVEEKMRSMAYHDALTSLPNRNHFAAHFLADVDHSMFEEAAILMMDLDRFKLINDTLGHDNGDLLLIEVSERLKTCTQSEDCLARIGGDEFILFLPNIHDEEIAKRAEQILARLNEPFRLNDYEMFITPSMGISRYPQDGKELDTLIKKASSAMQMAKKLGTNNFQFYKSKSGETTDERLEMETDLRKAIEREELVLYYQPKVNLYSGEITGTEALIRWEHPEKGLIPPGHFIPLAEETGLIIPIGEWVLRRACFQMKDLLDSGLPKVVVAVNLSLRQFFQQNFVQMVREVLEETGLPHDCLELEITESMMIDTHHALTMVCELKKLGVKISLDDFGTGYSSLYYLKKFPIDKIKIDRSFIRDCLTDTNDAVIVKTIIAIAHQLKMKVIAEGIETKEQLSFLQQNLCDIGQGYLFSQPVRLEELKKHFHEIKQFVHLLGEGKESPKNE